MRWDAALGDFLLGDDRNAGCGSRQRGEDDAFRRTVADGDRGQVGLGLDRIARRDQFQYLRPRIPRGDDASCEEV